jgi:hypothetical protein
MVGVIYLTKNLVNQKIYIGSDTKNEGNGDPEYLGSGVLLIRAIEKYGRENFSKEILQRCPTLEVLKQKEGYFIKKFKANHRDIGYNISDGYWGGDTLSNHPDAELIKEKVKLGTRENIGKIKASRKKFFQKETREEKEKRKMLMKKAMAHADKSIYQDPQYLKNLSEGIKNSDKFQDYVKRRTGKKRGKYKIDPVERLERRKAEIEKIQTPALRSRMESLLESDNSTFSSNLQVYLHLDGVATIPGLSDFIKHLEENIYTESFTLVEAKKKFVLLSLDKKGLGKSTVIVRALYDFDLYGVWPQRILGASKKF